jgi:hypothetical protein
VDGRGRCVIERFFEVEVDEHMRRVLVEELRSRTTGSRYFTFNIFNVQMDFDDGMATIEDELDAANPASLPLDEFHRRLTG